MTSTLLLPTLIIKLGILTTISQMPPKLSLAERLLCYLAFPTKFAVSTVAECSNVDIFWRVAMGLWSGLIIGLVTEYYTECTAPYELALKYNKIGGAPVNIIYGLALGYKSVVIPACLLFGCHYVRDLHSFCYCMV